MSIVWKVPNNVAELLQTVVQHHHLPRLNDARFAIAFVDSKPFIKNRFNWGRVVKFNDFNKLWQGQPGYDFSIIICSEVWHQILSEDQREAYLDLQLQRCAVEYEPEVIAEGNKKKPVKDEWGRIQYTNQIKVDDDGRPIWKVLPLDLPVLARNILRYGLWMKDFIEEDTSWLKQTSAVPATKASNEEAIDDDWGELEDDE